MRGAKMTGRPSCVRCVRGDATLSGGSRRPLAVPPGPWRRSFRRRLLAWYATHARDLPWRRAGGDPYAVWLSEIMLQQTQVATVKAYFERFLAALPTVEKLAAADEHEVLRLWEGLGYYRRARQLHQAARLICSRHGGDSRATSSNCAACRASGATRPGPSSPSPSTSRNRSWKPTPAGCSADCWPGRATRPRRPGRSSAGPWRKPSCRAAIPAASTRR